jgi:PAS domain S-box-containing protein
MLNKMKTVLTYLETPIIIGDTNNKILYLNPAGEEIFRRKVMELVGKEVKELFSSANWENIQASITQVRRENTPSRIDLEEGSRYFKVSISPITGDDRGFIGYVIGLLDITKDKEADQMKANFTSMLIHQLRSPLLGITNTFSELKNKALPDFGEEASELIEEGLQNSQRVMRLVDDLLIMSEAQPSKLKIEQEELEISQIIKNSVKGMEPFAEKDNVTLEWTAPPNLPRISGDQEKLTFALINLLSFSLDRTPMKGVISVSGKSSKEKDGQLSLIVTVSDTGEGIDPVTLPHLFDYHSRKELSGQIGSPLRLAAVKEIIEAHQGRISVVSEKGIGTTFSIILPAGTKH